MSGAAGSKGTQAGISLLNVLNLSIVGIPPEWYPDLFFYLCFYSRAFNPTFPGRCETLNVWPPGPCTQSGGLASFPASFTTSLPSLFLKKFNVSFLSFYPIKL